MINVRKYNAIHLLLSMQCLEEKTEIPPRKRGKKVSSEVEATKVSKGKKCPEAVRKKPKPTSTIKKKGRPLGSKNKIHPPAYSCGAKRRITPKKKFPLLENLLIPSNKKPKKVNKSISLL